MTFKRETSIRPADDATSYILSARDKPWFMERFTDSNKGRGVFTTQPIELGAFVLEYRGELISMEECRSRRYSETQSTFLFEFEWQKHHWCIDASREDGSLGRLVNDNSKSPNCIIEKVIVNDRPHLCLFAVKNIEAGTEIDYNHGDLKWREKVTNKQAPAVAVETETFPIDPTSHEDSNRDDASTQVSTVRGFSLVDYPDTDETDEDYIKDQPLTPHCDEVVRKLRRTENILVDRVPDFSDALYDSSDDSTEGPSAPKSEMASKRRRRGSCHPMEREPYFSDPLHDSNKSIVDKTNDEDSTTDHSSVQSDDEVVLKLRRTKNILMEREPYFSDPQHDSNESIVDETDDEDSTTDHSSVQSDDEVVPKRRRTKSILMDRIPDFSDALYDSRDDSTEGPSTSKSEMASQGRSRGCYRPIQMSLVGSDDSSGDSEEDYIPNPKEESTDSDCSFELSKKNKEKNKITSTSQSRCKSSSQNSFESSNPSSFKSSNQSRFKSSSQSRFKSSNPSSFKSSSQSRFKSSNQSRFKSSNPSSFKSSNQSRFKSSNPSRFKSSSQSRKTSHDSTQRFPDSRADVNEGKMAQTYTTKEASVSMPFENEASVYVDPVLKKKDGARSYNKKHHCYYCGQVVQKMSRHLLVRHSYEVDVAKAFRFSKNSKERHLLLDYIRNKGNFKHNTDVLESQKGKLIPCKQPKKKTEGQEYMHCVHCYGLFTRKLMWRHFQICNFNPQGKAFKPGKTRVQASCASAEPAPGGFCDAYWKFLSGMNADPISFTVKQDRCILEFGYILFKMNERVLSQHHNIRQKLRELGRLVLAAKKVTSVKTIKELIKPEKYSHVVTAARSLAGFSDETGKCQRPSLARKLGHSLHSLAMFIKSDGLTMEDKETVQDAEEFAQLYQKSWKFDIAIVAQTQPDQTKWNPPQVLPFTQDVQNLHSHLSEKQQQHLNALKQEVSPSIWKDLAKVTLAQVILFNRQSEGEVSRMPLSLHLSRDASETREDVNLALTPLQQRLCKHVIQIHIEGKSGRKVPVHLTPLMRESLDTLIEKREECGVLNENGFLFALPHSVDHSRDSDCTRQFVHECDDVKNPKALTSTKLRKHIATLSTAQNIKTEELDQLADFPGHNIDVHRKHHRLPEGTIQPAKRSKVPLALEQGWLGEYKDASMPEAQGSEDEVSVTSLQEGTSTVYAQNQRKSAKKRGKQTTVK